MPELNKANRQVCDVDFRDLKTKQPVLFFDTANTTTVGLTGDSVYAMKKGSKAIAFHNPIEGSLTIEAQVLPFKAYSLFSDGVIESTAYRSVKKTIKGGAAGTLDISAPSNGTIVEGSVFVYKEGEFGYDEIEGSFSNSKFTATSTEDIKSGEDYEVGYIVEKTSGVKRVSFNNKKVPKDFYIEMSTLEKDEDGVLTPFIITCYKATPKREFELSFSSEGDPATVSIQMDLLEDKDGNVMDIVEDTSEE